MDHIILIGVVIGVVAGGRVGSVNNAPNAEEWGTFVHTQDKASGFMTVEPRRLHLFSSYREVIVDVWFVVSGQVYTDFEEIRSEIVAQTDRIVGTNKVWTHPIPISFLSSTC